MYWAKAFAAITGDELIQAHFIPLAHALAANEPVIVAELANAQGAPVDLGGYYRLDAAKAEKAMRPSETLNKLLIA